MSGRWLLEVQVDGRTLRYSVEREEVETEAGDLLVYRSGLADLVAAEGDEPEVEILDESVGWPALGPELDGREAVLRRWDGTSTLEAARVIAWGRVAELTYGARWEPVSFAILPVTGLEVLGVSFPDAAAVVSVETFGATGLGDDGAPYPVVFGYPGWNGAEAYAVVPVPLARWNASVASNRIVVAEDGEQAITEVLIRNDTVDPGVESAEPVIRIDDLLGRSIRCATFGTSSAPRPTDAETRDELFAGYYPDGGGGPRSAYDVLRYVLRRWGAASVDWSRLPEVADLLGAYQVDTWVDSPVSDPWQWFEQAMLSDLPVEVRVTARGRYLVQRRLRTDARRVVGTIEAGAGAERVGVVEVDSSELVNELVGLYRRGRGGEWLSSVILTGSAGLPASVSTTAAPAAVRAYRICAASNAKYGLRQSGFGPIEVDWTWDEGTMLRVLQDRADEFALPHRFVEYEVVGDTALSEGDDLLLDDEELGWSQLPALVNEPPVFGEGKTSLRLRIPPVF